jgi:hypothetical protein
MSFETILGKLECSLGSSPFVVCFRSQAFWTRFDGFVAANILLESVGGRSATTPRRERMARMKNVLDHILRVSLIVSEPGR